MASLHTLTTISQLSTPAFGSVDRLPRPITSFIGREAETDALVNLVTDSQVQLVTVTGPGGIGKSRLALHVAHRCHDHFRDGVSFVGLADLRDPNLLPMAIAQALGASQVHSREQIDLVWDACRTVHLLLVADNLEHLLDSTPFLSEVLAHCPGVTILATSRRRLQLAGEHVFEAPPLPMEHAVALFEQRARAIAPDFAVTANSRQDVVSTCEHLDGLPLAIELAAARAPVLPPHALRERFGSMMELLNEGLRDAPERHRGIRQTIGWSYDLLTPPSQQLFRALAVFEGGFTFDAAAAVASDDSDVLTSISELQASSLVRLRLELGGTQRFRMLETVREYALERLLEQGEARVVRQAHADFIARLADDTERIWWESGGFDKLDELEPEMPNIRSALAWMQQTNDVPSLLRLAGSLAPMWASRGYSQEGRMWLEWGLPLSDGVPASILVAALRALSWILNNQHDAYYKSLLVAQYALSLSDEIGDSRSRISSLTFSGIAANAMGHPGMAMAWYTESLDEIDRSDGEPWAPVKRCIQMNLIGGLLIDQGDIDEAEIWYSRMLATQQDLGLRFALSGRAFRGLGEVARARGQPEQALVHFQTALHHARVARDARQIAIALGEIAGALSEMGHYEVAGRLFGASEAHHERISFPFIFETFAIQRAFGLPEPWTSMYSIDTGREGLRQALWERTAPLRAVSLDPELAQGWWNEGRALDLDAAVALIPTEDPAPIPGGLSPRELEVLRLLAQGHSDREIATILFISPRTVQNHVQHMYGKIGVSSRSAATRWAIDQGIA